jgi:DNA-directed RNA polymerase specialized sigma24 family protein
MNAVMQPGTASPKAATQTLGGLLNCENHGSRRSEKEWRALLGAIAGGDTSAFGTLYMWTQGFVFTSIVRITGDRIAAEERTVEVYHAVWRNASSYDPASGSVIGWIMNLARSSALERQRPDPATGPAAMRAAVQTLSTGERQAIEDTYFSELSYAELAAREGLMTVVIKSRIRSGLGRLRAFLLQRVGQAMSASPPRRCPQGENVAIHALRALPAKAAAAMEVHLATCSECATELQQLYPVMDSFVDWPIDDMRPSAATRARVARRISREIGREIRLPAMRNFAEPDWRQVSPGIWCKVLATDEVRRRVSMLVRLAPGVMYPAHTHASAEEVHLLDGELWIDHRKLLAGEFCRAEPGTSDELVWSDIGCTGLLITSPDDVLR